MTGTALHASACTNCSSCGLAMRRIEQFYCPIADLSPPTYDRGSRPLVFYFRFPISALRLNLADPIVALIKPAE